MATIAGVTFLALLLPVKARIAGEAGFTGSIGDLLDGVAVLVLGWREGAACSVSDSVVGLGADSTSDAVVVDGRGWVQFSVLGGILAVDVRTGGPSELRVLGIRLRSWRQDGGGTESAGAGRVKDIRGDGERSHRREDSGTGKHDKGRAGDKRGAGAKRGTDAERDTGAERGTVAESGADAEKEPKFRRVLTGFTELRRYLAPTVRKRTLAFIREVWSLLHFDLDVDVEYGFDDPGYTGMLYAAHLSVGRILGLEGLCLWPNFTAEMLEISGKLGLRFVPLSLVWSLARFALSKTIRPLWWKNRRIRLFGAKRGA